MPRRLALVFCLAIAPALTPGADLGIFRSSDVFTALPDANQTGAPHFEGRLDRGRTTHLADSIATDLDDSTNAIDGADFTALVHKMEGRP